VRIRLFAAAVTVAVAAAALAAAAPAQAPARATAAAVTGTLGKVARVQASGGESTSRSIPAKLPDGIAMSDGLVSVSTESTGAASAQAEAYDLELLGGAVSASIVSRTATGTTKGTTRYRGTVLDLVVGDREIGEVKGTKTYEFDAGTVVVNKGGEGLRLELTDDYEGFPAGTSVVIADVSARRGAGGAEPTATPTAEPTAEPTATATPSPEPTATPRPRSGDRRPSYRKRLLSNRFVFPVGGRTTIGGPFGSFRQIGAHQGNDLFADFGTPVVAVADGTIENVGSLPISGNRLWVYADGGDQFFYAHMASFAPAAVNGRHVEKGTILGYVGNTGDAEPTPPHLHFEIHPNGGDAVDPNQFLVAWQKRAGASLADTAERPGALVEVRDFIGEG
jgi:murein DD-endopeptidase MepM/ murein hydrolase activator NlpD